MMLPLWANCLIISILLQVPPVSSDKTYVIDGQDRVTWDEAFKLCQQKGLELVSIESPEENDRLRQILGPSTSGPSKDFWTSGTLTETNHWVWASTGRPLVFADWVAGAPNDYLGHEKCLRLWGLHHFRWDDFFCRAKLHFICQKPEAAPVPDLEPRSNDRRTEELAYGDDLPDSDFESANVVSVQGQPKDEDSWSIRKAPTTPKAPQEPVTQRPVPTEGPVLIFSGIRFAVFTQEALGWEDAREECNGRRMELAVITGAQAQKIQEFLHQYGLDHNNYWIGFLHVGPEVQRPRAKRDIEQWPAEQPSVQLTIGVKPGPGSLVVGAPTGQCPLLKPVDGMRLAFGRCESKNYYICEKPGPD